MTKNTFINHRIIIHFNNEYLMYKILSIFNFSGYKYFPFEEIFPIKKSHSGISISSSTNEEYIVV